MADILENLSVNAEPQRPSIEELKAAFAAQFQTAVGEFLGQLIKNRESLVAWLWRDDQLTPGQKVASLGTKARSVFERDAALKAFLEGQLASAGVTTVKLSGRPDRYTVTLNDDGSATVADAR